MPVLRADVRRRLPRPRIAVAAVLAGFAAQLAVLVVPDAAHAAPPPGARDGWQLVWRDDFTGPAGALVDRDAWIHRLGHCYPGCPVLNWGTGEIPEMTDAPENAALDGAGHLRITPLRDPVNPDRWTAARLETRRADFAAPERGALRVEARLALPDATGAQAQGFRTAFWMLGAPFRQEYRDPSGAGDLDVVENINGHPEVIGALHCSPPGTGDPCNEVPDNVGLAGTTTCPPAGCLTGMHTYAVEVHRESSPQRIDWLVDDVVYHSVRADRPGMDDATWRLLVDRSFFLILSQSIGGGWPGAPTAATRSGVPLVVDHVAVFVTTHKHGHGGGKPKPQAPEPKPRHEHAKPVKHEHAKPVRHEPSPGRCGARAV